ncbi:MAG: lipid-A-disaccharide synthase [Alphaproteobacteria bacterium]
MRIVLIAGEASGDRLGVHLIRGLQKRFAGQGLSFSGIGGPGMEAAGNFTSLFPFQELSHMGLDILPHLFHLMQRIRQTVHHVQQLQPDMLLTIDAPEFCFRVSKAVAKGRAQGYAPSTKLVHCVAPSVWAWRPGRAKKIASFLDHLMVLFPFEPPYFQEVGLPCTFVGHPLLQEPKGSAERFFQQTGVSPQEPLLCLLPGSRVNEIQRLIPVFAETIRRIQQAIPNLRVVLPTLPKLKPMLQDLLPLFEIPPLILPNPEDHCHAMAASTAALAASGTITLELAYHQTPMVVAYKVSWTVEQLAKRLLRVPYVSLVNIIAQKPLVPECLQEDCNPTQLSLELLKLFQDPHALAKQRQGLEDVIQHLQAPLPFEDATAELISKLD